MKNKKGFLLGEYTLKVIIAVLCLLLLVYLLFRVYSNYDKKKDLDNAVKSIESLIGKMNEARGNSPQSVTLLEPSKWILIYYKDKINRPGLCVGSCICLCEKTFFERNQIIGCEEKGSCREVSEEISLNDIALPTDLEIKFENNKFIINKK